MQEQATPKILPGLLSELESAAQDAHELAARASALEDHLGTVIYALGGLKDMSTAEQDAFRVRLDAVAHALQRAS
jgi:hypothetical protein